MKCPCCGYVGNFISGYDGRANACCPKCYSLERHRLVYLYIKEKFGKPKNLLHVAPEDCLDFGGVKGDINTGLDIERLKFDDNTFDSIIAIHVLEHVDNDKKALLELYRVLKPNGWAILQVPIIRKSTFENPELRTPEQRNKAYHHKDHRRAYGFDYGLRLADAGFSVTIDNFVLNQPDKYGLDKSENIYLCKK